jgi:hypothetical protein
LSWRFFDASRDFNNNRVVQQIRNSATRKQKMIEGTRKSFDSNSLNASSLEQLVNSLRSKWRISGDKNIVGLAEVRKLFLLQVNMHLDLDIEDTEVEDESYELQVMNTKSFRKPPIKVDISHLQILRLNLAVVQQSLNLRLIEV